MDDRAMQWHASDQFSVATHFTAKCMCALPTVFYIASASCCHLIGRYCCHHHHPLPQFVTTTITIAATITVAIIVVIIGRKSISTMTCSSSSITIPIIIAAIFTSAALVLGKSVVLLICAVFRMGSHAMRFQPIRVQAP